MDPTILSILVALLAVLITAFLFFRRGSSGRANVLLLGISGGGKTSLYSRLVSGKQVETFISIKENQGIAQVGSKSVKLVDIPGNERQRVNIFEDFSATARAMIFVIDSVNFMKEIKDVAEYLYTILSDDNTRNIKCLIACNKHDEAMSKSSQVIKNNLEKELNLLRKTQTSKLVTTEGAQQGRMLGSKNKDFEFEDLSQKVEFVEISVNENIGVVNEWLSTV